MKRILSGILAVTCLLCTGCAQKNTSEELCGTVAEHSDGPQIIVEHEELSTEATMVDVTEAPVNEAEAHDADYFPVLPGNLSDDISLSSVELNHVTVDVPQDSFTDILEKTGLKYISYATSKTDSAFKFYAKGFGVQEDPEDPMSFNGTTVYLEVSKDGIPVTDFSVSDMDTYSLYAIHSSQFFTHEDFDVVYAGCVKAEGSREDIEAVLGKGDIYDKDVFGETVSYKNNSGMLLISYDSEDKADDIYLFVHP